MTLCCGLLAILLFAQAIFVPNDRKPLYWIAAALFFIAGGIYRL